MATPTSESGSLEEVRPLSDRSFGPGVHQDGDIFAVSAFTNGGTNPTITVYRWLDACKKPAGNVTPKPSSQGGVPNGPPNNNSCADDNLLLTFASATGTTCSTADFACAAVNPTTLTIDWPYKAKFGDATNSVPPAGFFEGGLDITELFGGIPGNEPCISSFLMDTRSSATPSAVLKDFIGGGFNTCGHLEISKNCECAGLVNNTSQYRYGVSGTVTNAAGPGGIGQLFYNVVVTDPTAVLRATLARSGPGYTPGEPGAPTRAVRIITSIPTTGGRRTRQPYRVIAAAQVGL